VRVHERRLTCGPQVHGLNGSGRCPVALTLERARADCGVAGTDEMEPMHAHTVTGTVFAKEGVYVYYFVSISVCRELLSLC
jgi:hypothetical protein